MAGTLLKEVISGPRLRLNHHHAADILRHRSHRFLGLEVSVVDGWLGFVAGCSPPAVEDAFFFDDLLGQPAVALDVGQHLADLLLREADHEALVPPPQAVVGLVLEHRQLGHLLPAEAVIFSNLQQLLLQFQRPHVLPYRWVDQVTVSLSDLQLVLHLHL